MVRNCSFNALPQKIRDIANCKFDVFKSAVDCWLQNIPDEPHLQGYHHRTNDSTSNSLLDVIPT